MNINSVKHIYIHKSIKFGTYIFDKQAVSALSFPKLSYKSIQSTMFRVFRLMVER